MNTINTIKSYSLGGLLKLQFQIVFLVLLFTQARLLQNRQMIQQSRNIICDKAPKRIK
jgi:hypothetical protein